MGGLLAFRVGNYDNTAEREQFRFLCQQLNHHYENSNEFCVFAGNYNIGCELDALFIKKDAIIVIEFKNYGGKIVANENGEWTCDGKTIKGGSRKTVLQQARINHSIVKKELKALGVDKKNIKDVPTLIVFHQPISLTNNLSGTNKSWLHITDDNHFIEKLDDITCSKTDLSPLGIVNLAEALNLNPYYLKEFSNAVYSSSEEAPDKNDVEEIQETICDPIDKSSSSNENNPTLNQEKTVTKIDSNIYEQPSPIIEESESLILFVNKILESALKLTDCKVSVHDVTTTHKDQLLPAGISITKRFIVKVEYEGIEKYRKKLSRFINQDISIINPNTICWQDGDYLPEDDSYTIVSPQQKMKSSIAYRKSKTILPYWLDRTIFSTLEASYAPEHTKFEYNLNHNKEETKIYLGTYFPRSYAEAFCIFDNLAHSSLYLQSLNSLPEINILDFGSGTGGELFGLLVALSKHLDKQKTINVLTVDGNKSAQDTLECILNELAANIMPNISLNCINTTISSEKDPFFTSLRGNFHFILNSKMICELISRKILNQNGYYKVASYLAPHLDKNGVLYISDVTTKNEQSNLYYPQLMNKGLNAFLTDNPLFATVLPFACAIWKDCTNSCFMQQTFHISHSRKNNDESKICYRIICRTDFRNTILSNFEKTNNNIHIINPQKFKQKDDSSICPKSMNGTSTIDSFNNK